MHKPSRTLTLSLLLALPVVGALGCASDEWKEANRKNDEQKRRTAAGWSATDPAPATPASKEAEAPAKFATLKQRFKASPAIMSAAEQPFTDEKAALGRMLYYETRLSKNHDLSCNSCHLLDQYGVDGKPTSEGHRKQFGARNSPTVYFAAGHGAQFWDGRAKDVEEQALGPILNPVEMAMPDEESVLVVLRSIPGYAAPFKAAFPSAEDPITYANVGKAIGAFERKLVAPSAWDAFLTGDDAALTEPQIAGLKKFVEVGCQNCHDGAYVGGAQFRKLGEVVAFPATKDQGRFESTGVEADRLIFKVPSLRNIAKTAPYFHDGAVETLEEAIKLMANHQLGVTLSDEDVASIASFMDAMTGTLPMDYIAVPTLPESGPDTPMPNPK